MRDWINERVDGKNRRVQAVVIMDDFPRGTAGKTLKRVMREPYWAGHGTSIQSLSAEVLAISFDRNPETGD